MTDILDTNWIDELSEEEEKVLKKNDAVCKLIKKKKEIGIYELMKNKKIKIGYLEDMKVEE